MTLYGAISWRSRSSRRSWPATRPPSSGSCRRPRRLRRWTTPNICNIHKINETDDGQRYLVMSYYEGETLKQRIERGALALDEAVVIAMQVGQGPVSS